MHQAIFTAAMFVFGTSLSAQYAGHWFGVLEAGAQRIPLDLELAEADGQYTGGLLSPTQSSMPIPLSTVATDGDSLQFAVASVSMQFAGSLEGDSLEGSFRQGGFSAPLTFFREPSAAYTVLLAPDEIRPRPQEPTDFPYLQQAVTFVGGGEGVSLAGELTLPEDGSPRAALVLISGSGPQDRNQDLGPSINHRPFLVLSDRLTRAGYAVLRYDDRGVGASTGDFAAATSVDFAADAAAAIRFLRQRLGDQDLPIGLAGHSEGGMIAPMVAAGDEAVDFVILLAAPGLPIDTLMAEQRRAISGSTPPNEAVLATVAAYVKAHPDLADTVFRSGLRDTIIDRIPSLPESFRESITDRDAFAATYVNSLSGPWMRYFLAYDPTANLSTLHVPVLAINGERDTQVTPRNLEAIEATLAAAGNPDVTVRLVPEVNHLLQPADTGLPSEYGQIETTVDEGVLTMITDWLKARFP
ncbi:alpha/beta hydrolase [Lewinella sp. IMCC34191]|uniref:alpha/beta hydrolase n=1 Tax=Lewinella sp. IMCC34191 TaxID=2259172 RepID=UPI000E27454C|nr:alpha/beta fold hydrolase [Lewinella sp. IMCC34191]